MRSLWLRICAILLVSTDLTWPSGETRALGLEEAIRLGVERNPALAALRARADGADAEVEEAAAARWPVLAVEAGLRRTDQPVLVFGDKLTAAEFTADDFLLEHLNHPDPINHASAALSLEVPLFTSGRITSSIAAARGAAGASRSRLSAAISDLAARITEAYYAVPLSRAAAVVAETALSDARSYESVASVRFETGSTLRSDLLRARMLRLSRERDLEKKRADQDLAEARLRHLLALEPGQDVEPSESIEIPQNQSGEPGSLEEWTARSLASRDEIAAARHAVDAASAAEGSTRASLGPEVTGVARYERNAGDLDAGEGSWLVGVGLRWNALDRARASRLSGAAARRVAAQQDARATEDTVRLEVEQAYRDSLVADRSLGVATEMVAAAESARRITADRYTGGLLPFTEMLDVESELESARYGEIAARYDALVSRVRLRRAAGAMEVSQ